MLLRKALRSMWKGKRTYAAGILLLALGVAAYVGFTLTGQRMFAAMDRYYRDTGFS